MSAAEPGGKPMISRSGCDGKSPARPCATATAALSTRLRPKITIRRMAVLPCLALLISARLPDITARNFVGLSGAAKPSYRPRDAMSLIAQKPRALPLFLQCSVKDILTLCLGALLFGLGVHQRRSVLGFALVCATN